MRRLRKIGLTQTAPRHVKRYSPGYELIPPRTSCYYYVSPSRISTILVALDRCSTAQQGVNLSWQYDNGPIYLAMAAGCRRLLSGLATNRHARLSITCFVSHDSSLLSSYLAPLHIVWEPRCNSQRKLHGRVCVHALTNVPIGIWGATRCPPVRRVCTVIYKK
jgi:hypothetical protein